jgi:hypothetical protein
MTSSAVDRVTPAGGARRLQPPPPFVWAFALGAPAPVAALRPGESVTVAVRGAVAGGAEAWFARRVPPVTGPLFVEGAAPGDVLAVEAIAVAGMEVDVEEPWSVTIGAADERGGRVVQAVRGVEPEARVARFPVRQPGGPITIGPVVAGPAAARADRGEVIAAEVTIRCAIERENPSRWNG